jgi:hypothetical protein
LAAVVAAVAAAAWARVSPRRRTCRITTRTRAGTSLRTWTSRKSATRAATGLGPRRSFPGRHREGAAAAAAAVRPMAVVVVATTTALASGRRGPRTHHQERRLGHCSKQPPRRRRRRRCRCEAIPGKTRTSSSRSTWTFLPFRHQHQVQRERTRAPRRPPMSCHGATRSSPRQRRSCCCLSTLRAVHGISCTSRSVRFRQS